MRASQKNENPAPQQWDAVVLQSPFLHFYILSGFQASTLHTPSGVFKPLGSEFELWLALWDVAPYTQGLITKLQGWLWMLKLTQCFSSPSIHTKTHMVENVHYYPIWQMRSQVTCPRSYTLETVDIPNPYWAFLHSITQPSWTELRSSATFWDELIRSFIEDETAPEMWLSSSHSRSMEKASCVLAA